MRFSDKQKKIVCLAVVAAMLVTVVASIILSFVA